MTNLQNLDMNVYKGILERVIAEREEARNKPAEPIVTPQAPIIAREDNPAQVGLTPGWLYVPSIGMEFSPDIEGRGLNWYDCHKLAHSKNYLMPSIAETWELFFYAKANLDKPEFRNLYEYFTEKTTVNTLHSEWQSALFKEENEKMLMYRLTSFHNRRGNEEVLLTPEIDITGIYLGLNGYANISQRANFTQQGLCKIADSNPSYTKGENIYFGKPRGGSVAGFTMNYSRASLDCNWSPTDTDASLGVRFANLVVPDITKKLGAKK